MSTTQKIIAAALIGLFWLAAIVAKHFFPDADTSAFVAACATTLGGLGLHAVATSKADAPAAPADKQGGFARLGMLMFLSVFFVPLVLWGCATPTPAQVNAVRMACAADAGIRPSVDVMLAIPGLAKPDEVAAVIAARGIIDPICKAPDAPFAGGDPYVAVSQASGTIAGILVQVQRRKAEPK